MTDERSDLDRLQRDTIRQLAMETARLQNCSAPQVIWQAIAVGLTLLGRIL